MAQLHITGLFTLRRLTEARLEKPDLHNRGSLTRGTRTQITLPESPAFDCVELAFQAVAGRRPFSAGRRPPTVISYNGMVREYLVGWERIQHTILRYQKGDTLQYLFDNLLINMTDYPL
jgi:hypothetical protein